MINDSLSGIWNTAGIRDEDRKRLQSCVEVWNANKERNEMLNLIYEGKVGLKYLPDNVPPRYRSKTIGCAWPKIAISSIVERSKFDSFVFVDPMGEASTRMREITRRCNIKTGYHNALISSLKYGCSFAVVCRDKRGPVVRWHSALDAGGIWNQAEERLDCGFAIVNRRMVKAAADYSESTIPCAVDFYVEGGCYELTLSADNLTWSAEWLPDPMGEPRMVVFRNEPDDETPMGHSRISTPMKGAVQEYMANSLNIHVNSEFNAIGQKWATGLSDEQAAELISNKWQHSADSIAVATDNPNTGSAPIFGNFAQQSPEGLLSVKRSLATDFAAMASIPISELLSQDSNPTSAEALAASKDKLISLVEDVNDLNGEVLYKIALMLQAIDSNVGIDGLSEEQLGVMVHFRNPQTPTASAMADSAVKLASAAEDFSKTEVFWEHVGFDEPTRQRVMDGIRKAQLRANASAVLGRNLDATDDGRNRQVPQ